MNSFFSFIIAHFQLIRRPNTTLPLPNNKQLKWNNIIWALWLWICSLEIGGYVEMTQNIIACKGNDSYLYGIVFQ